MLKILKSSPVEWNKTKEKEGVNNE